jgi:hypothetical protein
MKLAFVLSPPENGTYMWPDRRNAPPGIICSACTQRIDYDQINPNYKLPKKRYDISTIYDGGVLVSKRFRAFMEAHVASGLEFKVLPRTNGYFLMECKNVKRVIPPRTIHFDEWCAYCKQYRSVWGIERSQLKYEGLEEPYEKGVFYSDLRTGYYPNMGRLINFGIHTWEDAVHEKFSGLYGEPLLRVDEIGMPF